MTTTAPSTKSSIDPTTTSRNHNSHAGDPSRVQSAALLEAAVAGDTGAVYDLAEWLRHGRRGPQNERSITAHDVRDRTGAGRASPLALSSRLIVLACTRRKAPTAEPIPAIDRYEGSCVPQLRAHLRRRPGLSARVRFLSAEHGWLTSASLLPPYDHQLTHERVENLRPLVWAAAGPEMTRSTLSDVLLVAEPRYLTLLADLLIAADRPRIHWIWNVHDAWPKARAVMNDWGW